MSEHEHTDALTSISEEIGLLRAAVARLEEQEKSREKRGVIWRWAGGIMAGIGITLGGYALHLATDASSDHIRVNRLEQIADERDTRLERLLEQQAHTAATLEQVSQALADLRTDVRELRADTRRLTGDDR